METTSATMYVRLYYANKFSSNVFFKLICNLNVWNLSIDNVPLSDGFFDLAIFVVSSVLDLI